MEKWFVFILEDVSHSYGSNKTHQAIPHLVKLYRTEAHVLLEIEAWLQIGPNSRFQQKFLAHQSNRPAPIFNC